MNANRELDIFNLGYDAEDGFGLDVIIWAIRQTMPRPDQEQAEALARAGHAYYAMECDALDDGARLPYRPR